MIGIVCSMVFSGASPARLAWRLRFKLSQESQENNMSLFDELIHKWVE